MSLDHLSDAKLVALLEWVKLAAVVAAVLVAPATPTAQHTAQHSTPNTCHVSFCIEIHCRDIDLYVEWNTIARTVARSISNDEDVTLHTLHTLDSTRLFKNNLSAQLVHKIPSEVER